MSSSSLKDIVTDTIKSVVDSISIINLGSLDSCSNLKGKECSKAYEKCFVNQCKKYGVYIHDNKKYKLPLDFYFNRLYQAYYYKYMEGNDTGYTILLKQLYTMLSGRDVSNSSSIGFTFRRDDSMVEYQNKVYDMRKFSKIIENMLDTSSELIFTNFNVVNKTSGHATVLIMEKQDNIWNFYYYDPNGSSNTDYSYQFLDMLLRYQNKKISIIPITKISCPISIQKYTEEKIGFCLMFSFFWIYCILNIINGMKKTGTYSPLRSWIGSVDKILLDYEKSNLYNIVVSFGIKLVNDTAADSDIFNREPNLFEMNRDLPNDIYKTPKISVRYAEYEYNSSKTILDVMWNIKCNEIIYKGSLHYTKGELILSANSLIFDIEEFIPEFRFILLFTEYMIKYCKTFMDFNTIKIQHKIDTWMEYLGFSQENVGIDYEQFFANCRKNITYSGSYLYNLDKYIKKKISTIVFKKVSYKTHKEFEDACINGDIEKIKSLVDQGFGLGKMIDYLLLIASKNGHFPIVKYLIEQGADIHTNDDQALRLASENGHLPIVQYLVEKGANIRAKYDESLRVASEKGHLPIVQYLAEKGADIHAKDDEALRFASMNGHLLVVKYLVENGANINAYNGEAIQRANTKKHLDIVWYLIEKGNNGNIAGGLALEIAVSEGNLHIVQYLVEKGADIHAKDELALKRAIINRNLPIVQYLTENGATIEDEVEEEEEDDYGANIDAFELAMGTGYLPIIKYLIENHVKTKNDMALRISISKGYLDIVKYLVENGADIHANIDNALDDAKTLGHRRVIEYLTEKGFNKKTVKKTAEKKTVKKTAEKKKKKK